SIGFLTRVSFTLVYLTKAKIAKSYLRWNVVGKFYFSIKRQERMMQSTHKFLPFYDVPKSTPLFRNCLLKTSMHKLCSVRFFPPVMFPFGFKLYHINKS
ncbi:MAG: hypothetical protein ABIN93_05920, partial [Ginsengibacter sp.]